MMGLGKKKKKKIHEDLLTKKRVETIYLWPFYQRLYSHSSNNDSDNNKFCVFY